MFLVFGERAEMKVHSMPNIPPMRSPTLTGRQVMGGGDDGRLMAIEVDTGRTIWRSPDILVAARPVESPRGDRVAVVGRSKRTQTDGAFVVHLNGNAALLARDALNVSWSADGNRIVYSDGKAIFVRDLGTGSTIVIAAGDRPSWSPDGRWLVFRNSEHRMVMANPDGGITRTLFDAENVVSLAHWSPDSELLLYVQRAGGWDFGPCARHLAGGQDVMVYRLRDGFSGRIYQLCEGGYPYGQFGWLRLPPTVQLPN